MSSNRQPVVVLKKKTRRRNLGSELSHDRRLLDHCSLSVILRTRIDTKIAYVS